MILVDTSVLIDYLRSRDAKLIALMQTHAGAVCGVIRAEVLCGARNAGHRRRLIKALNAMGQFPLPESIWDQVGDNLAALRKRGITVPFPDAVIATVGIENDVEVWSHDPHFPAMQPALPRLKLFQEPP
jgi:predicted nucleic acid-binding protein